MGAGEPVERGDALVVATSGSTGAPKGVVLTHDAVAASAEAPASRASPRTSRSSQVAFANPGTGSGAPPAPGLRRAA